MSSSKYKFHPVITQRCNLSIVIATCVFRVVHARPLSNEFRNVELCACGQFAYFACNNTCCDGDHMLDVKVNFISPFNLLHLCEPSSALNAGRFARFCCHVCTRSVQREHIVQPKLGAHPEQIRWHRTPGYH
jgi:hypothetical protein